MRLKIVTGGIIEKEGKVLLVQEKQSQCEGKWNVPSGILEANESLIEGAKREIFEETGCKVEITGVIDVFNEIIEGDNVVGFFFDTKLIDENLKADEDEISNVKWFSYEEIIDMKDKLRADGFCLTAIKNKFGKGVGSFFQIIEN